MSPAPSRRRLLRAVGAGVAAGLAGCSTGGSADPPSVTPAAVPTDRPTASPSPPPRRPPEADELGFWVEARDGFTAASPARLEVSLWNAGDRVLTVLDGPVHAVPFVDDDYVGRAAGSQGGLLLVPDGAALVIDPPDAEPASIRAFLPEEPTEGCWRVPFEWPADRGLETAALRAVPLEPGQIRRHGYGLYFLESCAPGDYRFENTFDLAAGDPPIERDLARARTTFEVSVDAAGDVRVAVDEPAVTPPDA